MTNNQLTDDFLQDAYVVAVSCEVAEREGAYMASFDLLCKLDDAGGTAHVVRKLIDMLRAERGELQELRRNYLALRGEIEGVRGELYEAEKLADTYAAELQEHRKAGTREAVRATHATWSDKTFGKVGPIGPLKHLSKEAIEAAAEPGDLSEWADMQFLLWDAQRRAGITDEQITQAMVEKLAVNESRAWPEPKDGEPRFHVKSDAELQVHQKAIIPAGWQLVPIEPTQNMIIDGFESEPDKFFSEEKVWAEYEAMSGCQQAAHRAKLCWAAMLAAAPTAPEQENI